MTKKEMIDFIGRLTDCRVFSPDRQGYYGIIDLYSFLDIDSDDLNAMNYEEVKTIFDEAWDITSYHPDIKDQM